MELKVGLTKAAKSRYHSPICLIILISLLTNCKTASAVRCHECIFHLIRCNDPLDCYNQPDTCSNTKFSPLQSGTIDCEFGCEQYVITDAAGSIVAWRRGCAKQGSPRSSYICLSRNIHFLRHDQCWCHTDLCNSAHRASAPRISVILLGFLVMSFVVGIHFGP